MDAFQIKYECSPDVLKAHIHTVEALETLCDLLQPATPLSVLQRLEQDSLLIAIAAQLPRLHTNPNIFRPVIQALIFFMERCSECNVQKYLLANYRGDIATICARLSDHAISMTHKSHFLLFCACLCGKIDVSKNAVNILPEGAQMLIDLHLASFCETVISGVASVGMKQHAAMVLGLLLTHDSALLLSKSTLPALCICFGDRNMPFSFYSDYVFCITSICMENVDAQMYVMGTEVLQQSLSLVERNGETAPVILKTFLLGTVTRLLGASSILKLFSGPILLPLLLRYFSDASDVQSMFTERSLELLHAVVANVPEHETIISMCAPFLHALVNCVSSTRVKTQAYALDFLYITLTKNMFCKKFLFDRDILVRTMIVAMDTWSVYGKICEKALVLLYMLCHDNHTSVNATAMQHANRLCVDDFCFRMLSHFCGKSSLGVDIAEASYASVLTIFFSMLLYSGETFRQKWSRCEDLIQHVATIRLQSTSSNVVLLTNFILELLHVTTGVAVSSLLNQCLPVEVSTSACPICFEVTDEMVFTPCFHIFHKHCLQGWLRVHDTCPMCKTPVLKHLNNLY